MPWHQVLLEYLRVLLSWPPIAGVTAILFLTVYRHQVRSLLSGAQRIKFPGGSELTLSQAGRAEGDLAPSSPAPALPEPPTEPLPAGIQLSAQQAEAIQNVLRAHRAQAFLWEYRYLNLFLVRHTQEALEWVAGLPQPTTVSAADAFWMDKIPDPQERVAVEQALETHHLIERDGELLSITEKGREYLKWRGPLPPLPPRAAV